MLFHLYSKPIVGQMHALRQALAYLCMKAYVMHEMYKVSLFGFYIVYYG